MHRLRKTLDGDDQPCPYLLLTPHEIQFNDKSDYWLDVREFSRLVSTYLSHHPRGGVPCESCLAFLKVAVELYKGDLLSGHSPHNCHQLYWWLLNRQEEYHLQALEILDCLTSYSESSQDYSLACKYAQRAIELEPWREQAHRITNCQATQ